MLAMVGPVEISVSVQYNTVWGEVLRLVPGLAAGPATRPDAACEPAGGPEPAPGILMQYTEGAVWRCTARLAPGARFHFEVCTDGGRLLRCEEYPHVVPWVRVGTPHIDMPCRWLDSPGDIPHGHSAGVAVPVFSLRTGKGFGIGEFADIEPLADWAAARGMTMIQLLPVNDTIQTFSDRDSYPYNAISAFALNPAYIRLEDAGVQPDDGFEALRRHLEDSPVVLWPEVIRYKLEYLRKAYSATGAQVLSSEGFRAFYEDNSDWLLPYAMYCCMRDAARGGVTFPGSLPPYDRDAAEVWAARHEAEAGFWYFVQYHLHLQLLKAARHAHSKGVGLKGDLPIGVNPRGVDVWTEPDLFNTAFSAGAPPDAFSAEGQNWGFPTYNWEAMKAGGYGWWKRRLGVMQQYFDAYRIDHILGFFRIWEIPRAEDGSLRPAGEGYFSPEPGEGECIWRRNALERLTALSGASDMLMCGEDLGVIPAVVPDVLARLGILSLEVQRMPKSPGLRVGAPEEYPYLSVATTGTHDMETLRSWAAANPVQAAEARGSEETGCQLQAPPVPLLGQPAGHAVLDIVRRHLGAASMLIILPVQDWLCAAGEAWPYSRKPSQLLSDRINDPSDPGQVWNWRL